MLALNEVKLPGFRPRDFRFSGIHDARNDSPEGFDDPAYYVGKPRTDFRRTVVCTSLTVLAKSAAALLVSRHLAELPDSWDIVCVCGVGDAIGADLAPMFRETRTFAPDVRISAKRFERCSWVSVYVTGSATVCFFFLSDSDRKLVEGIRERFAGVPCLRFQASSLTSLVGNDWPAVETGGVGSRA